jgi:glycosyltransferase involved in cell wall biosynthesis
MKKRILIIIPNLGRGGAQQIFRQQMQYLSHDYEVTGCVFNWNGSFGEDKKLHVISLDVPAGMNFLAKAWFFCKRISALLKIKKQYSIDIAISHLEGADYVNLLSRVKKCKAICWIHGTKKHDENISGFLGLLRSKLLMPLLYKQADAIVTVSQGIAKELSESIKGLEHRIATIYNGLELEQIHQLSNEPLEPGQVLIFDHPNVIITHCRLSRQKNLTALLSVFNELRKSINVRLLILGDGELRDQLILYCKDLGSKVWSCWSDMSLDNLHEVYFVGHQSNPFKMLKRAKLFVMTSAWEGFPLALCEAMACGLPVITTDCYTGPREILFPELPASQPVHSPVESSCGFLMPLVDVQDESSIHIWSAQLRQMFDSGFMNNFNKENSIERAKQFQISKSIEQTIDLLHSIG